MELPPPKKPPVAKKPQRDESNPRNYPRYSFDEDEFELLFRRDVIKAQNKEKTEVSSFGELAYKKQSYFRL